ncbi:sensor histidine kinase [Pararhodospirillum photometricum]|nr:PAS domain S-box protein [Pararhodospirillum photometricum]
MSDPIQPDRDAQLRRFFDLPFLGIAMMTPGGGRWSQVNQPLADMLKYPRDLLETLDWTALTPPEDLVVELEAQERIKAGLSNGYHLEKRFLCRDGSLLPVLVSVKADRAAPEPLTLYMTVQDISEHKETQSALRESEEKFHALANNTSVLVWMSGLDGLCYYFNKVWLDFTGRSLEQEYGNGWAEGVHPDDLAQCLEIYQTSFAARREFLMEYRLHHHDGTDHWLLDHGVPRFDGRGSFLGYIGSCLDITATKESEAQLRAAHDKLARANEELEKFAYVTSHDLREPMRMISCYLGLIRHRMGDALQGELAEYFAFAIDGAKRMDRMIGDLLLYSRIGRDGQHLAVVPLAEVVAESLINLQVAINEAGAEISVAPGLPQVRGAYTDLVRLFQNLIGNALKYRIPERPCRVEIGGAEHPEGWEIWVRDNGIGIEAQYFDRVFEIFKRLVPRDQPEGTGIGLAVCKKIMETHGGRVSVESLVGQGSTFRVVFPRAEILLAA